MQDTALNCKIKPIKENNNLVKYILVGIFSLGAFLRTYHIGTESFWFDEAHLLLESQKNIRVLFGVDIEGIHPPLYRLLIHFWMNMGRSEIILRIPSLIFSMVSGIFIYKISKLMFNRIIALYSLFLFSISPFQIYYAQEVKMYSLLLLLSLGSAYFFLRILKEGKFIAWVSYIFFTILSIFTHYFGFFNIFIQNCFLLSYRERYRNFKLKWLIGQLIILLLFSPWLVNFVIHFARVKSYFWIQPVQLKDLLLTFKNFVLGYYTANFNVSIVLIFIFILFLIGINSIFQDKVNQESNYLSGNRKLSLLFLLNYLFSPLLFAFLFSKFFKPIYLDRSLIISSPFLYIILALGIERIKKNIIISSLAILMIITASAVALRNYYNNNNFSSSPGVVIKKPLKQVLNYIISKYEQEDIILLAHPSLLPSFEYYCPDDIKKSLYLVNVPSNEFLPTICNSSLGSNLVFNIKEISNIDEITRKPKSIWLVCASWGRGPPSISPAIKDWIKKENCTNKIDNFPGIEIYSFRKNSNGY